MGTKRPNKIKKNFLRIVFFINLAILAVYPAGITFSAKKMCGDCPRIEFEHTEFDFGEIPQRSRQTHGFRFHNTGVKELRIESVSST